MSDAEKLRMMTYVKLFFTKEGCPELINSCNKSIKYFKAVCNFIKSEYGDMNLAVFILYFIATE